MWKVENLLQDMAQNRRDAACQVEPSLDPAGADRSLRCHHPYADADQRLTS